MKLKVSIEVIGDPILPEGKTIADAQPLSEIEDALQEIAGDEIAKGNFSEYTIKAKAEWIEG